MLDRILLEIVEIVDDERDFEFSKKTRAECREALNKFLIKYGEKGLESLLYTLYGLINMIEYKYYYLERKGREKKND